MTFKYFIKLEIPNRKLIRGPRAGLPINEDKIGEACKAVPIDLTLKKNIYIFDCKNLFNHVTGNIGKRLIIALCCISKLYC